MTPEKFFDYLEGKLPPDERERLERALIADPELQRQFASARQVHRGLERDLSDGTRSARAGSRGRQVAVACIVLVAMNVALGLIYIFRVNRPSTEVQAAREATIRHQLQSSIEKSAAATFTPPTIGMERIAFIAPRTEQNKLADAIISAATKAGGSGTKALPNDTGVSVLVLIPGSAENAFRQTLVALGGPSISPLPGPVQDIVRLQIDLSGPP